MQKKVVLIYPKIEYGKNYTTNWIPYSVLTLGSFLHKNGHSVDILDENENDELNVDEIGNYDLIGISSMTGTQLQRSLELVELIKRKDQNVQV